MTSLQHLNKEQRTTSQILINTIMLHESLCFGSVRGNWFCIWRAKIYINSLFAADVVVMGLVLVLVLGQTSLCAAVSNCQHWLAAIKVKQMIFLLKYKVKSTVNVNKFYLTLQLSWKPWVHGLRSSFPTTFPERLTAVRSGRPTLKRNSSSNNSRTFDSLPEFAGRPGRVREEQCVLGPGAPLSCLWVTQSLPQEWLVHTFHQERGLVHPALSDIVLHGLHLESVAAGGLNLAASD